MLTTVQPLASASSALVKAVHGRLSVVSPFSPGVGVVDVETKVRACLRILAALARKKSG
jgi:hypothetical protein